MNVLKRRVRRKDKPTTKPRPTHAADRDSLPAFVGGTWTADTGRLMVLPEPEPPRQPSAALDDPTPIFDAVMTDKWWEWDGLDVFADEYESDDYYCEGKFHALHTQFEVALLLDEPRLDMDEAEHTAYLEEIAREAAEDVDFGWDGP